jgi:hypothetical protein
MQEDGSKGTGRACQTAFLSKKEKTYPFFNGWQIKYIS